MADKRCENGHYIDESWDLCPYCPQDPAAEIAVVKPAVTEPQPPRPAAVAREPRAEPRPAFKTTEPPVASEESSDRTVVVRGTADVAPDLSTKRYVVGWLVGLNGSARGESFPVRMGRNVLGRDRRADIVVNDDQASAHHADLVFRPEEGRFILMDHNSTNGTYVNEAEIEPRRDIGKRDIIRIGAHRFLFIPLCSSERMWDAEGELR